MTDNNPLVKEIYLDANPELVFSFLAERDKILRWMGLTLEIDPKPGGIFRSRIHNRGDRSHTKRGRYLAAPEPSESSHGRRCSLQT